MNPEMNLSSINQYLDKSIIIKGQKIGFEKTLHTQIVKKDKINTKKLTIPGEFESSKQISQLPGI